MQTGNRSRSVCVGSQEENSTQWAYKARYPKIVCRFRISPGLRECRGLNERSTRIDWKFTFQALMVRLNIRSYIEG